ncbi:Disease resistance protein RGA5, partial [Cucurbita argyrosperma subsp. sororia]
MQITGNIETIGLVGDNKDKLEIVGDLDPIKLIEVLRKKFSYAQLESVSIVEVKDKDKDKDEDKNEPEITWTCSCGVPPTYGICFLPMVRQKIVIRVSMKRGAKYRSKALKIAASVSGDIETISLVGDDKDKIEVVGDLDPIELTEMLRKRFGCAQLESECGRSQKGR